jgi:hypothetical protein
MVSYDILQALDSAKSLSRGTSLVTMLIKSNSSV